MHNTTLSRPDIAHQGSAAARCRSDSASSAALAVIAHVPYGRTGRRPGVYAACAELCDKFEAPPSVAERLAALVLAVESGGTTPHCALPRRVPAKRATSAGG